MTLILSILVGLNPFDFPANGSLSNYSEYDNGAAIVRDYENCLAP